MTRREIATRRLQKAAAHWAKAWGGSALVVGVVQTIKWPDDAKYNYTIGIRCTGLMPSKPK